MEASSSLNPARPLSFVEKCRVVVAATAAVLLLNPVGWAVVAPADPDMGITFVLLPAGGIGAWPELTVLAVVAAVIGTALAGRRLPEAGVFAAAVGLAALALRGGSMRMLLAYQVTPDTGSRRAFMWAMALDTLMWTALMAVVWVAVMLVWRWLWSTPDEAAAGVSPPVARGSGKDAPTAAAAWSRTPWSGWPALAVTGLVGLFVIWTTIARTPVATIARGQVIASIAGGLYLGAMAGRYFTGIDRAIWYVAAAPAIALVGWLLGYLAADMRWAQVGGYKFYALLAITPPHNLARPLPVEYVAVGVAAALCGFWGGERIEQAAQEAV